MNSTTVGAINDKVDYLTDLINRNLKKIEEANRIIFNATQDNKKYEEEVKELLQDLQ